MMELKSGMISKLIVKDCKLMGIHRVKILFKDFVAKVKLINCHLSSLSRFGSDEMAYRVSKSLNIRI